MLVSGSGLKCSLYPTAAVMHHSHPGQVIAASPLTAWLPCLPSIVVDRYGPPRMQAHSAGSGHAPNVAAACNAACSCTSTDSFAPVCGGNGVVYYNACFAGCTTALGTVEGSASDSVSDIPVSFTYSNCSCVSIDSAGAGVSCSKVENVAAAVSVGVCLHARLPVCLRTSVRACLCAIRPVPNPQPPLCC